MLQVSVIIPAYNCSLYLRETLASVLNQGVADLEIIVVNDGSSDDTGDIARSFGAPVTVIDQANAGVCAARNRGIRQASGEFIALVDHDDFWLPNKLANQLAAFKANPQVDVVFSRFSWWHPDAETGKFELPQSPHLSTSQPDIDSSFSGWIYHRMLLDSHVLTSTALIRANVFKDIKGFDERLPFGEDWDFWLRISRRSQFLKLKEQSTLYRQHPNQGSRVLRNVDYRTQILEDAVKQWGLCSPDGQCLPERQFKRQLAKYSAEYGLGHLKSGTETGRKTAVRSFSKAFSIDPTYWRSLAYLVAARLGWRPTW